MFVKQEYFLWKLAHDLVNQQGFEMLHVNVDNSEIWLERDKRGKVQVIRLFHGQFNWRNELIRDLERIKLQMKQNKRLFRGKRLSLYCLYISEYPPVDEWEEMNQSELTNHEQTTIHYLDDVHKMERVKALYEELGMRVPDLSLEIDEQEAEGQVHYLKQLIATSQCEKKRESEALFTFGKPMLTYVLLALNILAYLFIEYKGSTTSITTLIEYGAKYNPAIVDGEWWRILSSMFLHIGTLHLLMNMLALYYLGAAVERIYGTLRFTFIYFLAGIFGGLASFMLNPQVAAGASGAIFGLFGALLYFGVHYKRLFFRTMGYNLIFVIGINLAFGILVPQVDNGAHMGGLLGGFIASAVCNLPKKKQWVFQSFAAVAYTLAIVLMIILGIQQTDDETYALIQVKQSQQLNEQQQFQEAIALTNKALDRPGNFEAELLFNRSYAYTQTGQLSEAQKDLEQVIEIDPEFAEAYFNLALIYRQMGEVDKASKHASEATKLKPDNEQFQELSQKLN
ncbi:rhomboid family intramembrane serine protease [Halobacillus shinanisalinarum]|uniref:Rhomboid family intramembrane serine protease n=1 Tax=Halobacillus shinanisalinarum TaxID=2932258 RepID=A0ABY4H276_9BACI|nr:rhomboid family intramembrane serine protease [Halobacillus shinanisalinarum]UOQ93737.1 rhomboid family intramembrane serine protease [Halobacillus shinanisalinarum]